MNSSKIPTNKRNQIKTMKGLATRLARVILDGKAPDGRPLEYGGCAYSTPDGGTCIVGSLFNKSQVKFLMEKKMNTRGIDDIHKNYPEFLKDVAPNEHMRNELYRLQLIFDTESNHEDATNNMLALCRRYL